jgi:hypothetical protein
MSASLNNEPVLYMLIMFMGAAVGWVLNVRLSEQETCAMLSYFFQRDCWLLHYYFQTHP